MMPEPTTHRAVAADEDSHFFEDLEIGQRFPIPSRTMTDALFAAFQLASADNHPSHYDVEYCRAHGHPGMLAHGFQTLIQTAPGAGNFPDYIGSSLVGFLEQSSRFLKPVYVGDTLYPMLEVADLKRQRTTGVATLRSTVHNQKDELVLEGELKFLIRLRDPNV
jgi:acyl dehydratase